MLTVNQRSFHEAVRIAKKVTDKIPTGYQDQRKVHLSNVESGVLLLRASNKDTFMTIGFDANDKNCEDTIKPVCIKTDNLEKVLRCRVKDGMVTVSGQTEKTVNLKMTGGTRATLNITENQDLVFENPSPDIEYTRKVSFDPKNNDTIKKLKFLQSAISRNEIRRNIECVRFEVNKGISTDGKRLNYVEFMGADVFEEISVPVDLYDLMLSIIQTHKHIVEFYTGKNKNEEWVRLECGGYVIEQKLENKIDFPEYENVMPTKERRDSFVEIDPKELKSAIMRVYAVAEKTPNHVMKMTFHDGILKFSVSHWDLGEFETDVSMIQSSGRNFIIGIDTKYFTEAIFRIKNSKTIQITTRGDKDPVRIDMEEDGMVAVVMPVRI